MFTGIVQDVGRVESIESRGGDVRLRVRTDRLSLRDTKDGDSVCVGGVCLTALDVEPAAFSADVSRETLSLTTLEGWRVGALVNLEPALRAGDPLGGHLVSGHVDGVGLVQGIHEDARSRRVTIAPPAPLMHYLAKKGSVALDGVSLTINEVAGAHIEVNLIPHTWQVTTLAEWQPGRRVNIEVDQVARYVERLLGR